MGQTKIYSTCLLGMNLSQLFQVIEQCFSDGVDMWDNYSCSKQQ
jgi:hypothetical protein